MKCTASIQYTILPLKKCPRIVHEYQHSWPSLVSFYYAWECFTVSQDGGRRSGELLAKHILKDIFNEKKSYNTEVFNCRTDNIHANVPYIFHWIENTTLKDLFFASRKNIYIFTIFIHLSDYYKFRFLSHVMKSLMEWMESSGHRESPSVLNYSGNIIVAAGVNVTTKRCILHHFLCLRHSYHNK